jgi:hypothetical protein
MPSLEEKIARAQAAPKPYRDVDISLDPGVSDRIAELDAQLDALAQDLARVEVDARLSDPRRKQLAEQRATIEAQYAQVRADAAESLVTFRFVRLDAQEWADITARAPKRDDSAGDAEYGFNYHQVGKAAAVASGMEVDGDTVKPVPAATWQELFTVIAGSDLNRICDAIINLNVWGSYGDFLVARRASSDATATASSSPSPSESHPAA